MAKIYVAISECYFGEEIRAFDNELAAESFINSQTIDYFIKEFDDLGIDTIYVCTCEEWYGQVNEFPIAIFATFEEADTYGIKTGEIARLMHDVFEIVVSRR